jgi:hypothetical protein
MTPTQLLATSLLLGLFVLLAGCYGLFYCLGRMRASRRLGYAAEAAYVLQGMTTILLTLSSLDSWWKAFILASFIVYFAIPPLVWRFLVRLHEPEEQHS